MEQQRISVLLDAELRQRFNEMCAWLDTNASEVTRGLIERFSESGDGRALNHYTPVNIADMPDASRERKTARLTILIEPRTKKQFEEACTASDMTSSQVVRRLIRQWMEDNDNPRSSASSTKPKRHR